MHILGRRKRGGKPVRCEWERDGLFRYLRVLDASGKPLAVVEVSKRDLQELLDNYP